MDAMIIDFSKTFNLDPQERLFTKRVALGMDWRVVVWVRELIPCRSYIKGKSWRATIQGSQSNLSCVTREHFGPTIVCSVHKRYLEDH